MRRFVPNEVRERASGTASVTLQVTATIYAILIAFVIVDAYSQLRDTQSEISRKASALAVVYENSRDIPDPSGEAIRQATLRYARTVVNRGIPRLEDTSKPDVFSDRTLENIFRTAHHYEAKTESERAAYGNLIDGLDQVVETRATLLDSARASIPTTLLALLVVIGLIVMAVATFLDTRHRKSHLMILSALGLVIWLTIALVISLDYPFSGLIRVTDEPIKEFVLFRAAR